MGVKGAKLSNQATEVSQTVVTKLRPLGTVTAKKMFGGYGIFESGAMFALIDSSGAVFLKVDDTNRSKYEEIQARPHGRMPYYQIPAEVLKDDHNFQDWVKLSLEIAHKLHKK
jgi:DNA transformation protein